MDFKTAEKIATIKNYRLSDTTEEILEKINERNGQCPCRIDGTKCPCKWLVKDVQEHGSCHCGLFLKKNEFE